VLDEPRAIGRGRGGRGRGTGDRGLGSGFYNLLFASWRVKSCELRAASGGAGEQRGEVRCEAEGVRGRRGGRGAEELRSKGGESHEPRAERRAPCEAGEIGPEEKGG
jgi:hypothetical protein